MNVNVCMYVWSRTLWHKTRQVCAISHYELKVKRDGKENWVQKWKGSTTTNKEIPEWERRFFPHILMFMPLMIYNMCTNDVYSIVRRLCVCWMYAHASSHYSSRLFSIIEHEFVCANNHSAQFIQFNYLCVLFVTVAAAAAAVFYCYKADCRLALFYGLHWMSEHSELGQKVASERK